MTFLLAQLAAFNLADNRRPVLTPSIQGFLSDACSIPLSSINIIWKAVFQMAWNTKFDISPVAGAGGRHLLIMRIWPFTRDK